MINMKDVFFLPAHPSLSTNSWNVFQQFINAQNRKHCITNKVKKLSQFVKQNLLEYNYQIVESDAVLADYIVHEENGGGGGCTPDPLCLEVYNLLCQIGCGVAGIIICTLVCGGPCSPYGHPFWCWECIILCGVEVIMMCFLIVELGCTPGCEYLCCL